LKINREIQQQQVQLQQIELDTYKRELVKEVKTAYYNYLMSGRAIVVYQNAVEVVQQNLRVNQALLKNGKGLPAYVSRAESEVRSVLSQLQAAINEQQNAKAYFNFLLNKSLEDTITVNETNHSDIQSIIIGTTTGNVHAREELKSLAIAEAINQNVLKMNRGFSKPRLNAFLDLASQGFNFAVNNKSLFYLGGLQLQVPIFTGKRNLYKIQEATMDAKSLELNKANTTQQLELAALVSRNNAITACNNYLVSLKQEEAAQKYFKLIDKGFTEGVNSFIEFLDARNQLTNSKLQSNINQFKLQSANADYERQTASYTFNQ
jgi:outer membrane protein TolC